jgi:Putative adhesin
MKKLLENTMFTALVVAMTAFPAVVFSQKTPPSNPDPLPKVSPTNAPLPKAPVLPPRPPSSRSNDTTERSMKVDPGINLEFSCVIEGKITVNGWNRNEIRVFVANGNRFTFRTAESSPKSGDPVWVKVIGTDTRRPGAQSECLNGSEIEVDAPLTSTIRVRGREISTTVDSVKKAEIASIGGDITIRNVTNGVSANAGQGDITVEASQGAMQLSTTTGNILVFEAGPSEIGDAFKANTNNGAVSLQGLQYRQVNVDSISGSLGYQGPILKGASYNMRTSKGSIMLSVPKDAIFQLLGTYGYGYFNAELPVDIITETVAGPGPIKSFAGSVGKTSRGDAVVKVSTVNGSITLKPM